MVLRMTRPTQRKESKNHIVRKRVPADILPKARGKKVTLTFPGEPEEVRIAVTLKYEVKFSLTTHDRSTAKLRTALAESQLQAAFDNIRRGPVPLTHKQIIALSGRVYRFFANLGEDNPGDPKATAALIADNQAALAGRYAPSGALAQKLAGKDPIIVSLEARFGPIVDAVLSNAGVIADDDSRAALLQETGRAFTQAAQKVHRNAEGDYRPDPNSGRFPAWETTDGDQNKGGSGAVTLTEIYEGWKREATSLNRSVSTLEDYEGRIKQFRKWLGHDDAGRVTIDDVLKYKDHRLTVVSAITVKNSDLVALKVIFGWAKDNRKVSINPAADVRIKAPKQTRERDKRFTSSEAAAILAAAGAYRGGNAEKPKTSAAKRWVPWLCAYTGARVGEMAQLRKSDFLQHDGHWFVSITPEAGTVKTKEARVVPVHEHLVEQGFMDFVERSSEGYLFLTAKNQAEFRGRWRTVKNRVTEFVRPLVKDPRVAPNHGWRHTFKSVAHTVGIADTTADAICGHAPRTTGDYYRQVSHEAMAMAIKQFPRYDFTI